MKDRKRYSVSRAYDSMEDAEEQRAELWAKEEYQGKNLQVIEASHPVDPRKPPRRRKNR